MQTEVIRTRIDPQIKKQAAKVMKSMGLTMSDGMRLFLYQVVQEKKLPFKVKAFNAATLAALEASESHDLEPISKEDLLNEWPDR
jgi:DNA-damage-inducible protein J